MSAPAGEDPFLASDPLEDLVAGALEALDRSGEEGLAAFFAQNPDRQGEVAALLGPFRATGLLARDAGGMPERLGEFRLLRRLGSGGMGVVFLAEQESLRRTVALKAIRPDLLFFEGTRQRFRREIEVIARLSHSAIVPIVATGEHDGMPWYAMQFVAGCSADEAVRRLHGRDPARIAGSDLARVIRGDVPAAAATDESAFAGGYWQACVHLARQAALGLAHAHAQGIVHRDVKPSNVMLTPDGRALLVDFGLALVQGDARLTQGAGEPGSPAYMAPEQVRGLGADERSDVYSLAATLTQMLDLQAPFAATDAEQLRTQIVQGERQPPQNAATPRELRLVLSVAMDVDRERRYATAAAFAEDLAAVLAQRPIAARPLPLHTRALRWAQRHRTAAAVLMAALLIAAVLPAVLAWQRGAALVTLQAEKDRVERSRDQALEAVREFLVKFASSDLETSPGGRAIANQLLGRAQEILAGMTDVDERTMREHRTYVERWMIDGLRALGRNAEAKAMASSVLARWPAAEPHSPAIASLLAGVRMLLVQLAADGIEVADVDAIAEQAARDIARMRDDPDYAVAADVFEAKLASHRGLRWRAAGDLDRAANELRTSLAKFEGLIDRDAGGRWSAAEARNRLAEVLCSRREFDEAETLFAETVGQLASRQDRVVSPPRNLPLWSYALWGLAMVAVGREKWEDALRFYATAAEVAETAASCFSETLRYRSILASILTEYGQVQNLVAGNQTAGRKALERARVLFDSLIGKAQLGSDDRKNRHTNFRALAAVYASTNDHEALAELAAAFADTVDDARSLADAAWNLLLAARSAEAAGRPDRAAANNQRALAALLACDQAGWFPPVDLADPLCQRLRDLPGFTELHRRHPQEQVVRRPPRRQ